jgi:hypothetical protein
MAISLIMGFSSYIDRAAIEVGRRFKENIRDENGLFPRTRQPAIWLKPIQRSACITGINFSLWRSCCSAAQAGLVQSLENESPPRKTPANDPEFASARPGCTATE